MARNSPEGAAVGTFVWVIPFKLVAVPPQYSADAFDQPQVATIWMLGHNNFSRLRGDTSIGMRVDQNLISLM
jgi:hypothetical protein